MENSARSAGSPPACEHILRVPISQVSSSRARAFPRARAAVGGRAAALFLAAIIPLVFNAPAQAQRGVAAIFMYHHVSPTIAAGPYARALTVTPAEFAGQLAWLRAHSCLAVSVDRLLRDARGWAFARCEVALTFDDGYQDAALFAEPLLKHYGDTGTFYISTGFVSTAGHVSLAQIRVLHHDGMEIGAHTVHHVDLTAISGAMAQNEIAASARSLRQWLRAPVSTFAYPAGEVNVQVASSVEALHFDNAVTTQPGVVTARSERYELPRYRIERGTGLRVMAAVLGDAYPRTAAKPGSSQRALEHIAWERIAGNAPDIAEAIGVALLARKFPEQILKVHVLALQPAMVAGVMLSGVKFHRTVDRAEFGADVREMIGRAFAAAPQVGEVDVWAIVPMAVSPGTTVSGDYAAPTSKTVFSAAVMREAGERSGHWGLGVTYWDPQWLPPRHRGM
jgi:peptidoglycan/xylan/chitin deacetylase (PgdA/CDA1 family)